MVRIDACMIGSGAPGPRTQRAAALYRRQAIDEATVQAVVPAGHWQAADTTGDWTLVSCTVSPGFRFDGFALAPPGFDIP